MRRIQMILSGVRRRSRRLLLYGGAIALLACVAFLSSKRGQQEVVFYCALARVRYPTWRRSPVKQMNTLQEFAEISRYRLRLMGIARDIREKDSKRRREYRSLVLFVLGVQAGPTPEILSLVGDYLQRMGDRLYVITLVQAWTGRWNDIPAEAWPRLISGCQRAAQDATEDPLVRKSAALCVKMYESNLRSTSTTVPRRDRR